MLNPPDVGTDPRLRVSHGSRSRRQHTDRQAQQHSIEDVGGMVQVVLMDDTLVRCFGGTDPAYARYHDDEWGRPVHGDDALYERLVLEGFQAGLSWWTILRKRDRFREVFAGFDPQAVAAFDDSDVERLMGDAGIVRNRAKIVAAVDNARALLAMHRSGESLDDLVWSHAPTEHVRPASPDDLVASSPESVALSKALKARGFRFVGPTTVYAAMQACGLVDDHVAGCWRATG
jgi:DNA-3-methyladenine glycosylase I